MTAHSLRHTFASLQVHDGVSLIVFANTLGQSEPSTSANIYGHIIADAAAKAASTFDRFAPIVLQDHKGDPETNIYRKDS